MKAKAYWCVFILLLIAFVVVCKAVRFEGQRNSLYGLNGVFVPPVALEPEYEEYYGIDRRILQNAIELRLRRNGIKVLDERTFPMSFLTVVIELYPKKHEDTEPKICAAS